MAVQRVVGVGVGKKLCIQQIRLDGNIDDLQALFTDYLVAVVNGERPDIAPGQGVFLIAVLISGVAGYNTFVIDFLNDGIFCRLL